MIKIPPKSNIMNTNSSLDKNIQYLKGIGEKRAASFAKPGIFTIGDLLYYFPRDYEDWKTIYTVEDAPLKQYVCIKATVISNIVIYGTSKGKVYATSVSDGKSIMPLRFFNNRFVKDVLKDGEEFLFYGKVTLNDNGIKEMISPKYAKPSAGGYLHPVYPQTGELSSSVITRAVKTAIELYGDDITETLPQEQTEKYRLQDIKSAIKSIHFPSSEEEIHLARRRLIYEELLTLQLGLLTQRKKDKNTTEYIINTDYSEEFIKRLPFELTSSQKNAVIQCIEDMKKGTPMQRLLQGDVGSGKTAVAACLIYTCVKNGYQCVLMAPTEVLAAQHFVTLSRFFEHSDIKLALLTGSVTAKNKKLIKAGTENGDIDVVIGTHAVITEDVSFRSLALAITDEQHRFGVKQRAALRSKGKEPHILVMSATPIPRTLSLIIYGDLDISVLNEKPNGRKEIKTYKVTSKYHERLYNFIKKEIDNGHQCYIVCPLVEENEENPSEKIAAQEYTKLLSESIFRNYRTDLLHGKMKPKQKDEVMNRFKNGETDILICTVVVEVGIDVPNATLIVIENAECFGLSQLHQLRGRVGRGDAQSYCVLVSDSRSESTNERLDVLCSTNDGFKIADEDLKMRGPGDFFGSRQSGLPMLKIADLMTDSKILFAARDEAMRIVKTDPSLSNPEYKYIKKKISSLFADIS